MAGLCDPLSTIRQYPHGYLRMTRGRCGSLLLHRDGLAPSTPCRSPGALRSTPMNGLLRIDGHVSKVPEGEVASGGQGRAPRNVRLISDIRRREGWSAVRLGARTRNRTSRARATRPTVVSCCPIYNCVYKGLSLTDRF